MSQRLPNIYPEHDPDIFWTISASWLTSFLAIVLGPPVGIFKASRPFSSGISRDNQTWVLMHLFKTESVHGNGFLTTRKEHLVKVYHNRNQNAMGAANIDSFMESQCCFKTTDIDRSNSIMDTAIGQCFVFVTCLTLYYGVIPRCSLTSWLPPGYVINPPFCSQLLVFETFG
jgi:hypothetical protein